MKNIKQYIDEGKTYSEIARIVGRTPERIRQVCGENGWKRKPFNYELPKVPSRLSILRLSGKPWCHVCKKQDIPLMVHTRTYSKSFRCRECNRNKMNEYYNTEKGNKIMREVASRSYHKLKKLKNA